MWGSDVDSIMQAFGSVGSTWESHAQQQRIPQEGPTGDCVTRHVPEGGVCKASSNDTNQHACLLPYINCARGLEFMERDTPTRGAETVHGDVSCRVSAVVSADAIRALSLEERGASESTCIASDALTMASGVPGDLNVTPHASDVEACITDVMVPTSHIPNDMKEDHRDPVDVGTGRSDGGNGPPVSHGKRVHHCYKCGVTGHHPAMCQVDVRYMMCGVHGRRRSEKNLYYDDVTGRYQCRTQFQCKTSGRRMGGVRNDPVRARNNGSSMPTPYVTHAVPPGLLTAQTTDVSSRNVDGNALVPVHRSLDGQTNGTMSGSIGGVPLNLGVAMVSPFPSCYTNGNIWPTPSIPFAVGNDGNVRALPMFIPPGNNFVSYDGREVRIPNGASITYVPGATSMTAPQPPR